MAAAVDEYMDSAMDTDDVFPCKGCGEILEEGKAFELAGNRWHLDCFRCNQCRTLLDSDANLLLLGDGSLICNNCTYSCSACGNKIEDLAILTGDQAFCATCFRCRNCKRKIENLRYARTSQDIFCMDCHETLMARRRKKSKAAAVAKSREKEQSPMITEKSLPALPPNAIPPNAFSNDRVEPDSDTPTELSPRPRGGHRANESSSRGSSRPSKSPERSAPESTPKNDGLTLPASSYRKNRNSAMFSGAAINPNDAGDGFLISVALDTNPPQNSTPKSVSDSAGEGSRRKDKDYFNSRPTVSDKRTDSHSSTPHIAFQEKGRQMSSDQDIPQTKAMSRKPLKSDSDQTRGSPTDTEMKLQEAPRLTSRPTASRTTSSQSSATQQEPVRPSNTSSRKESQSTFSPPEPRRAAETPPMPRASQDSKTQEEEEIRASLDSASKISSRGDSKPITRKEVPPAGNRSANGNALPQRRPSTSDEASPLVHQTPPSRSGLPEQNITDTYMQPRAAPLPPGGQTPTSKDTGAPKDAHGSPSSPKLPRWSSGADFTLEEDMARILGTDEGSTSILRRVSNAVRHGRTGSIESSNPPPSRGTHARSISETTRATASPRWPKTPIAEDPNSFSQDISTPASVASPESPAVLKRQLRNSEQRVAELERQFNTEKDLKNLNKKLIEKRKTVSVLDTQTEIMIRQLEVLSGYVERAKETKTPIDPHELEDSAIKEFVQKLELVKQTMCEEIEALHEERDALVEEKNQAVADRDRALMEFEQLSSKNAQLADMNNDLTHQIQERFKSQINDGKASNGLGIYSQNKGGAASSINLDAASIGTGTTLAPDEDTIVEHGPTVVQVRKGQVKKFNWKKGSKTVTQGITSRVNRAVVALQASDRERMPHQGLAGDSIGLPYNMTVAQVDIQGNPTNVVPGRPQHPMQQQQQQQQQQHQQPHGQQQQQQFGFFGGKKNMSKSTTANALLAVAPEPPSTLFGSELVERCDFEHRQIPNVVTRCIEEVELRGMDQEGIYRKTGGNSQINMIKDGFGKSESYDISDPDLDITAVTSVLKQYFRKLPTPLLTFDVYERVLESTAIADDIDRCHHLNKTFTSMPQSHRDCLEFLMFHLHRVAQREPENLMSPKNLAVVFAPTIMRDLSIEREMTDMHAKNLAVQFVIENTHRIFEEV